VCSSDLVSRIYKEIAPVLDIDVLTHRRITDLISELNMLGVINTRVVSRGRYGRTKEMWFDANTSKIWDVIQNDQRLSAQGLGQMDIQWVKTLFR
jgi:cell division control protein 6